MISKTILLTGAHGFIGSAFLRNALKKGYRVRVLTRHANQPSYLNGVEYFHGDLLCDVDFKKLVFDVDVIVHAAAETQDKNLMRRLNVDASLKLLDAAIDSGVQRWVQLSSVGAYGSIQNGVVDERRFDCPVGCYEKTKSEFDNLLNAASQDSILEVCIVRPSIVYGPGMRNQSIKQMVRAIRRHVFAFVGPEGASANYVHVNDVVQALDLCAHHPRAADQIYIVSAWATLEDMVSGLSAGAGYITPRRRIPMKLAMFLARVMQWWPRWPLTPSRVQAMSVRSRYSTKKIESELGWKLTVPVKEGMREFARDLG